MTGPAASTATRGCSIRRAGSTSAATCWSRATGSRRSGRISARRSARDVETVDLAGLCLAPGLVDMRVQLREPGAEHMESIESGGQAAAAGGVTTMVALPNTEPPVDDVSVVEFLARRAREVKLAKIHTYAAATKGLKGRELTEIGLLAANGAVGFTDGVKAVADALVMRRLLSYARSFDQLVIQHPEEPSLGAAGEVTEGEIATRLGLPAITPAAEIIMVERDLRLVAITGARYHVAHVSTARRDRGDPPGQGGRAAGHLRHRPALFRAERDRDRRLPDLRQIVAAVAQRERPPRRRRGSARRHDRRDRQRPRAVGPGFEAPAVQLGGLRHRRAGDVAAAVARAVPQPASEPDRGAAAADRRARPAFSARGRPAARRRRRPIWSCSIPTRRGASRPTTFRSKSKNAPFDGRPVQGRVERTIVDGRTIFARPGKPTVRRSPAMTRHGTRTVIARSAATKQSRWS